MHYVTLNWFHKFDVHESNLNIRMQIYFPSQRTSMTPNCLLGKFQICRNLCSMVWPKLLFNLIISFFLKSWPSNGKKENVAYALKSSSFSSRAFIVYRNASSISSELNLPMWAGIRASFSHWWVCLITMVFIHTSYMWYSNISHLLISHSSFLFCCFCVSQQEAVSY